MELWWILHWFTYCRSFLYKHWTILHFLVTFFIRFEEKQIKKADEANKTIILSFSILVQTLVVSVNWIHIKTSTLTAIGLWATSHEDANCKTTFRTQLVIDKNVKSIEFLIQLLWNNYETYLSVLNTCHHTPLIFFW